jgi:hypothetical protein
MLERSRMLYYYGNSFPVKYTKQQCSGCGDPYRILTDPEPYPAPDPAIFVSYLQDANKKKFFCLLPYFLKVHLHNSSKIKSQKEVPKGFFLLFSLVIEGSVPVTIPVMDTDPGSQKTRILWIWNTANQCTHFSNAGA